MRDRLTRTFAADLEVRSDKRTVVGIAVPFDSPIEVPDFAGRGSYTELFRRGAFERTINERGPAKVKFLTQHDRERLPVGRASVLREDTAGLYSEFQVSKTQAGDELLELVRDGAVDGLSIGFRPVRDGGQWPTVERLEVRLDEVSATPWPAYPDARVTGVRSELALLRAQLDPPPPLPVATPTDVLRRRLDLLEMQ